MSFCECIYTPCACLMPEDASGLLEPESHMWTTSWEMGLEPRSSRALQWTLLTTNFLFSRYVWIWKQGLSLNLDLNVSARLLARNIQKLCLHSYRILRIQMVTATPGFLGDAVDPNSGPHAPVMTTWPTEPSPLPSDVVLKKDLMALPITINFSRLDILLRMENIMSKLM